MNFKLQIAGFVVGIAGSAALGIYLAVHYESPGFLFLCIPAFAVILAAGP